MQFNDIEIKTITELFILWGETPDAVKEWGDRLSKLKSESGACAMVSETFLNWLRNNGFPKSDVKMLTGEVTTEPRFKIGDENAHTVLLFNNRFIVDLTAKQFNPVLPFPRYMTLAQFKNEWSVVS